jgi:hypothetical protein
MVCFIVMEGFPSNYNPLSSAVGYFWIEGIQDNPWMYVVWFPRMAGLGLARRRVYKAYKGGVSYTFNTRIDDR